MKSLLITLTFLSLTAMAAFTSNKAEAAYGYGNNYNVYDNQHRLQQRWNSNGSGGYNVYDNQHRLQQRVNPNGSGGYNVYDNQHRLQYRIQ